ncbi:peptidoglycan editing factor PgeF [Xylanibacter brevis]|uniref:peptidoglycan editing factor PgeF n=1 Tax=Xylanibacter brevis TaxID=83231 RepID=UPI000481DFC6|nr:peptidoglycan editing factor PgeF [Xylanibacter brevis]
MKQPVLHNYHMGEGVTAFSTTRQGGYSEGRYGEFNINRYCGDSEEAIGRNRQALTQLLGIDDAHLLMPHQVHLTEIAVVGNDLNMNLEGYDALMTDVAGVCIGVSTADCIPVLLYDRRQRAVCAIHAGWRGTVKRITEKAVARMTAVYGTQPQDVIAQIGPGIHLDSFEVGDEVYDAFAHEGFNMPAISRKYPVKDSSFKKDSSFFIPHSSFYKWHIDLPQCNRLQLIETGIPAQQISVSGVCTFEQSERFFSARRLGIQSGRIFTAIML